MEIETPLGIGIAIPDGMVRPKGVGVGTNLASTKCDIDVPMVLKLTDC
jgi:hypothetical protein